MKNILKMYWVLFFVGLCSINSFAQTYCSSDFTLTSPDGTFLGSCNLNQYDSNSIFNKYGNYGSKYSSTSIWNQYSQYGSQYSDYSAFNKYANNPPIILYQGIPIGRLTVNRLIEKGINPYTFIGFIRDKTY